MVLLVVQQDSGDEAVAREKKIEAAQMNVSLPAIVSTCMDLGRHTQATHGICMLCMD